MAITQEDRLRAKLGERIPAGGTASDTLFSDEEISDLVSRFSSDFDSAVAEGWEIKAATLAQMVDTAEGNSRRNLSALHRQALVQLRMYRRDSAGGRTRIGRVTRDGFE